MFRNKLTLAIFMLLMSIFLVLLISCEDKDKTFGKCKEICKVRTNFKNGANRFDENGFGEFNRNGSPRICDRDVAWPKFTLMFLGKALVVNNGKALDDRGLSTWFDMERCLTLEETLLLLDDRYRRYLLLPQNEALSSNTFLVEDRKGVCEYGGCIVYAFILSPDNMRVTLDKDNCGINIDIKAYPIKIGDSYLCRKCNCVGNGHY